MLVKCRWKNKWYQRIRERFFHLQKGTAMVNLLDRCSTEKQLHDDSFDKDQRNAEGIAANFAAISDMSQPDVFYSGTEHVVKVVQKAE